MLDIKYIRDNRDRVSRDATNKNIEVDIDKLLELDDKRRELTTRAESLRAKKNKLSNNMSGGSKPSEADIASSKTAKAELTEIEEQLAPVESEFMLLLKSVPNVASDDTPVGSTEGENKVVYEKGDKPTFDFEPKNHWEIAQERGWIDKERAAKVTGSRFAYLKGDLVRLQLAIVQFTMDTLSDEKILAQIIEDTGLKISNKPFVPVLPPLMIRTEMFDAMDRLEPREDRYKIEGDDLWLQGSAEHVLGSMHADETLAESEMPLRYIGYATSFRREAGTYGKDMEGIIRMHQFDKLEMEIISKPENGMEEHLLTIAIQEYLLTTLQLPYRKLLKCTADIGKPNFRGVDMDTWFPGQNQYRETHTADYMTDYQTRRLNTKVETDSGKQFAYTIDATAIAPGRLMIGIIENNQTENMRVVVPKVLQKYMGGVEKI